MLLDSVILNSNRLSKTSLIVLLLKRKKFIEKAQVTSDSGFTYFFIDWIDWAV